MHHRLSVTLRSFAFTLFLGFCAVPFVSALPDRTLSPVPGFEREAASVVSLLEQFHYNRDGVKPADYGEVITTFMNDFDSQHMFFVESDKLGFTTRYTARWIYNNITSLGKTDPAYDIYNTYEKRVVDRINWVLTELNKDIDLTGHDGYLIDRKEAPWPTNAADADALWSSRIKYEIIQEMLNEKSLDEAKTNIRKRYERWLKNLSDIESKDVSEAYLSAIARLYDPHSTYFSAETFEDFSIQMRLQLIGIGAVLSMEDDYCTINEIVVGGPADLSKQLHAKDKIIAVAQGDSTDAVEIIGMKLRKVVQLIRGSKGSKVKLTVIPASDPSQRKEVVITRDVVNLDSARARGAIYDVPAPGGGTQPIGVITLPSFYDSGTNENGEPQNSATQDVAKLITQLKEAGIKGLVLDLRSNGGGLLPEAIALTGLFVKAGPVVQVRNFYGQVQVDNSSNTDIAYDGPLAVLVSKFSASASEIVAGALQNYGRAIIIGDAATHGKGTVQQLVEMKNVVPALARSSAKSGAVKLTIQKFYLPSGDSTQLKGVVADIALPSIDDYLPIGEKTLPHALVWDEIAAAKFEGKPLNHDLLTTLHQASEKRQDSLEEFTYLRKNINWFKNKQEQKTLSLNLEERREQKAGDKAFKKSMDEERNTLAKSSEFPMREFLLSPPKEKKAAAATSEKPAAPEANKNEDKPAGALIASTGAVEASGTTTASVSPTSTDKPEDEMTAEELEADAKKLDIHLRESLRVLSDAINMPSTSTIGGISGAPLTAQAVTRN